MHILQGDAKAVLKDGAIPTVFDIKSKPEPQTYRRKRPGEPVSKHHGNGTPKEQVIVHSCSLAIKTGFMILCM